MSPSPAAPVAGVPHAEAVPAGTGNRPDRGWYLAVEYREIRSKRFKELLREARKCGRFQALIDESGQVVYRNLLRREDLAGYQRLFDGLRRVRCAIQCTVNGQEFTAEEVSSILACALPRLDRPTCPEFGTLSGQSLSVGCDRTLLFSPGLDAGENARFWWEFGTLDGQGLFHPDREGMRKFLFETAYTNAFCPMVDRRHVLSVIDRLPEAVRLQTEFGWEVFWTHHRGAAGCELFGQKWKASSGDRRRLVPFTTRFILRHERERATLWGLDGQVLGWVPDTVPVVEMLMAGDEFVGMAVSAGPGAFEFILLREFHPPHGIPVPRGYVPAFKPENSVLYQGFLKKLFQGPGGGQA